MIKKILIGAAAIGTLALAVFAASPNYKTLSGFGTAATPAEVDFISDPVLQFRLVNVNYGSDTNTAVLSISTGTGAYAITATNAATTSTTNQINSTNGLPASSGTLFLEHAGAAYVVTLSSYNNTGTGTLNGGTATNVSYVVLASGGFGVATSVDDSVYVMSTPVTLPVGAATNVMNGDAIYVGNQGRPVRVQLTPASITNKLFGVTGRYE